jgi:hypothetical protein
MIIGLSGLAGLVIGLIAGRWIDPLRRSGTGANSKNLKQVQDELDTLKARIGDHFQQTANHLQQLRDQAKSLHNQLITDAAQISGISLQGQGDELDDSQKLAHLITGESTFPPRDYAPKAADSVGMLSEEYGLKDDEEKESEEAKH